MAPLPEPWPEPVDGEALLDEMAAEFDKYIVATDYQRTANILWVAFAHTHDCWTHSPALNFTAPTADAGKTTALKFTRRLESWLGKSGQRDKWSFCLIAAMMTANRRDNEQTTAPEPHTGIQVEGGSGRHQG
jgi:hypothetical protein